MYLQLLPEIQEVLRKNLSVTDMKNLSLTCSEYCSAFRPFIFRSVQPPDETMKNKDFVISENLVNNLQYTETLVISSHFSTANLFKMVDFKCLNMLLLSMCKGIREENFGIMCGALPNLKVLVLYAITMPSAGFAHLEKLTSLEDFFLESYTKGSLDCAFQHLGRLNSLKEIEVKHCSCLPDVVITGAGFSSLSTLVQLETLKITETDIETGDVFADLVKLQNLRVLNLGHCVVTEQGYEVIGTLQSLEELNVDGCQVLNEEFINICKLRNLKKLNVSHMKIYTANCDFVFSHIRELKSLEELILYDCHLSDNMASNLMALTNLRTLDMRHTFFTQDDIEDIFGEQFKLMTVTCGQDGSSDACYCSVYCE